MSAPKSRIPPEIRAKMEAAKKEKEGWLALAKSVVNVPQAEAVFVPRARAAAFPIVASRGIATCVGLVVEGERGVFFAHIDSRSEPLARRIAGVALGFVGNPRRISITTSHKLPQLNAEGEPAGGWHEEVSAERIYRGLMRIFIDFPSVPLDILEFTDAAFRFDTGRVGQAFPYSGGKDSRTPGLRYLSILSTELPTLQEES